MTSVLVRPEAVATFTVDDDVVTAPETVVETNTFESSTEGWTLATGTIITTSTPARTGSRCLLINATGSAPWVHKATKVIGSLTVGRDYTCEIWAYVAAGASNTARIYVDGVTAPAYTTLTASTWTLVSFSFTATATSHTFVIEDSFTGTSASRWDDFVLTAEEVVATTVELPTSEGKITMDDSWSPYVQAIFDVPLTGLDLLEQIDPKAEQRVFLQAINRDANDDIEDYRNFDLGLRKRTVNHKDKTISVELASDEALLIDKRRLADTVDATPRTYEDSLRDICSWALGKIGATLEAGTDDADLTAAWPGTNLMPNPSGEVDTAGWVAGGSGGTIARVSGGHSGSYCIRVSNSAAGYTAGPFFSTSGTAGIRATPGKQYTTTCWVRSNRAVSVRLAYQWAPPSSSGATTPNALGATVALVTNTWTKLTITAQVPQNVDRFGPYVYLASGSYPASSWIEIDEVLVYDTFEDLTYFDGSTATDALYTYEWDDAAHNSVARRVPIVERPRELFAWKPGTSLWDFLQPLFEASGLRLFCDEQRVWRLIDPETYEVDGFVLVQEGHNATEGEDIIDRNEEGLWAEGVVCVYTWTDELGIQREAYDFAGTDGKVHTVTYEDTPFPGPGAAAYILARMQGRGRQQEVTAFTQYGATPGQDIVVNLPGTLPQTGKVQSVIFDLKTGLMEARTRGLIDALPGSWAAWNPAETWAEVDPGMTWEEA